MPNDNSLSWTAAKKVCKTEDFERLACAFLHTNGDIYNFNKEAAAAQFNPDLKPGSFYRSIWVIVKKIQAEGGTATDGDGGADGGAKPAKGRGKRKAASAVGGEEPAVKKSKGKKVRAKARAKAADAEAEGDESADEAIDGGMAAIKTEDGFEIDDAFH